MNAMCADGFRGARMCSAREVVEAPDLGVLQTIFPANFAWVRGEHQILPNPEVDTSDPNPAFCVLSEPAAGVVRQVDFGAINNLNCDMFTFAVPDVFAPAVRSSGDFALLACSVEAPVMCCAPRRID